MQRTAQSSTLEEVGCESIAYFVEQPTNAPNGSPTSFQAQAAHFRFSPDSGRIAASHGSATKSADAPNRGGLNSTHINNTHGLVEAVHSITTGLMRCSKNSSDQLVGTGRGRKRNERPGHRSRNYPERSAVGSVGKKLFVSTNHGRRKSSILGASRKKGFRRSQPQLANKATSVVATSRCQIVARCVGSCFAAIRPESGVKLT
jgi:hypothetical protein